MLIRMALTAGIFQNDFEPVFHSFHIRSPAYIQEVGRLTAGQFDNVHGGHGQTGNR